MSRDPKANPESPKPVEPAESAHSTEPSAKPEPAAEAVDWAKPDTWPKEVGGNKGPEPTRYGDWENNGRCTDF